MSNFDLEWFGDEIIKGVNDETKDALLKIAADLTQLTADEAPLDEGDLRGNAGVDESNLDSQGFLLVGYSLPYALKQHESLDFNHPQGGKAKFLEDPYNANSRKYVGFVGAAVKKELK